MARRRRGRGVLLASTCAYRTRPNEGVQLWATVDGLEVEHWRDGIGGALKIRWSDVDRAQLRIEAQGIRAYDEPD